VWPEEVHNAFMDRVEGIKSVPVKDMVLAGLSGACL
jgi:hypothetical protein